MKNLLILGSTGSIGESSFKVVQALKDRIRVVGIAGNRNLKRLGEQASFLHCSFAATGTGSAGELQKFLPVSCKAYAGNDALCELVKRPDVDVVLCAIVGTAGLMPVLEAIRARKTIALASKEILVMAGDIVMAEAAKYGVRILPVDSEHSAIFQCLQGCPEGNLENVILTASGGPFRTIPAEKLSLMTSKDALKHPTWNMGAKVTIDSSTLMNKALEMIEAHHLFSVDADHIKVVVHPQSVVHSMIEMKDGVVLAQMSNPDMRFPIQYALTYPERCDGKLERLDLVKYAALTFEEPDRKKFPSLGFAEKAIRHGGVLPCVLNAANEVAAAHFLAGEIRVPGIFETVEKTMELFEGKTFPLTLDTILEADREARKAAEQFVSELKQ